MIKDCNIAEAIFDSIEDAALVINPDLTVISINKNGRELFGEIAGTSKSLKCNELICKTGVTEKKCPLQSLKTAIAVQDEHVVEREGRIFRVRTSKIFTQNNELKFLIVLHDITNKNRQQAFAGSTEITEKLKESEEKYRALYDNAPLAFQSLDKEGNVIDVNPQWLKILGYKKTEVIGKWFGDFLQPEMVSLFKERFPKFKKSGVISGVEFNMRKKDGSNIIVSFEGCIGYDEKGDFKQTYCTFKDITESKRFQSEIAENEKRLTKLFSFMNSGVVIYKSINNGDDFEIIGFNKAAEKITNTKCENVLGSTLLKEFPKMRDSPLFEALKEVCKTGKDKYIEPFYYKDAKREGWRENNIYKINDAEIVAVFADVNERINYKRQRLLESNIAKEFALNSESNVFQSVLEQLLEHFNCEFGYIGYINKNGDLECPSMTYNIWDKCQMADKSIVFTKENWAGAWGESLKNRKTVLKNEGLNVPQGHIQLENTLVTVISNGKKTVGQIALANKNGGFNKSDKRSIELLGKYMSPLLLSSIKQLEYKQRIELHNERLESLLRIARIKTTKKQELLDYALKEAIGLTQSKIGYIYFYNENTQLFTLNTWSKEVMKDCRVINPKTTYNLQSTGCWGEVVRHKKPIVINDYAAFDGYKKGTPEGHIPLTKFMSIPVLINDEIVAVAGVGNKQSDYSSDDVRQLTLLMDNVWKISERIDLIESLKQEKEKVEKAQEIGNIGSWSYNIDDDRFSISEKYCQIFGLKKNDLLKQETIHSLIHPEDKKRVKELWENCLCGIIYDVEYRIIVDNTVKWVYEKAGIEEVVDSKSRIVGVVMDITTRKNAEWKISQINKRFEGLEDIVTYKAHSIPDLLDHALSKVINYTNSDFGAIYHYDQSKQIFYLNNYSDEVSLTVEDSVKSYKITCLSKAVKTKRPVIDNNGEGNGYSFLTKKNKNDIKSLTIPILVNNSVKAVFWVASYKHDYHAFHAKQVMLLLETTWIIVEKQKLQDAKYVNF